MKQGNLYLKIVVGVLVAIVVLYFLLSILQSPGSTYTTYQAVIYKVGDGISTSGFVVRDEKVLQSSEKIIVLTRSEGERVGVDQPVAVSYSSTEAQSRQTEIDTLEEELEQLEYAYKYSGADTETASLDTTVIQSMNQLAVQVNRRNLDFADSEAEQLKKYVLRRGASDEDADLLWERITEVRNRLNALYADAQEVTKEITTDEAGYFSGTVDGYETVLTPEFLNTATVADFNAIGDMAKPVNQQQIGKLTLSSQWYYITVVDAETMQDYSSGDRLTVHFAYDFYEDLRMTITRIGQEEDGKCVLVLSSSQYMQDAVSLRTQAADIVFGYKDGLRVPKKAIYVNEKGDSGVYVLEGAEAEWKTVNCLYYNEDSVIVELDQSSTNNLWPEDEIILTDHEIYDGKVMG